MKKRWSSFKDEGCIYNIKLTILYRDRRYFYLYMLPEFELKNHCDKQGLVRAIKRQLERRVVAYADRHAEAEPKLRRASY
jgi:hypothetical protein